MSKGLVRPEKNVLSDSGRVYDGFLRVGFCLQNQWRYMVKWLGVPQAEASYAFSFQPERNSAQQPPQRASVIARV
jgi:hypothetical protein